MSAIVFNALTLRHSPALPTRWLAMLRLMLLAQALDLLTTLACVAWLGIGAELNPVSREAWALAGPLGLVGVKVVGAAGMYWLSIGRRDFLTVPLLWFFVALGALAAASNTFVLLTLLLG